MKSQVTTRYLLSVTVSLLVLCANAGAGPYFFDDFSDGNMTDGLPVNWIFGEDLAGGTEGYTAADLDGNYYIYRDVSVSVQIKRISDHTNNQWVSGFVCRWLDGATGGYWIEVRPPNRFLFGHRDRYILRSATLPFAVDETELIIRVDAVRDQLKAWCWPADEPMPQESQISFVDNVAPEGTVGFYYSTRGGEAIYRWVKVESLEVPIVDFNGDGKVDIKDLLNLIKYWGQNEPAVDINGDGTVDEKDLEILMQYWDQNVDDPTLTSHWALDEAEGSVAYDSAGVNDAAAIGNPAWQPTGGHVEGALQLDGVDDCIATGPIQNLAESPFSALLWIKSGVPGRVVLSQADGANWLCTDTVKGCLMTELRESGRSGGAPLLSEAIVTDDTWHRIGLVWDGSYRHLYVDGAEVAKDAAPLSGLKTAGGGLYIGAGSNLAAGSFFSGLIDDVRIYNRAVIP